MKPTEVRGEIESVVDGGAIERAPFPACTLRIRHIVVVLLLLPLCAPILHAASALVEAESFKTLGGWVVDQQFMDQMGSPYLLAHGLGMPVTNATTEIELPQTGEYRVWVRTKDWVPPHRPGRFKVILAGKPADKGFGTEGTDWMWQDGGIVQLAAGKLGVELQDLTGFEGRCDAIYLTTDADERPPAKPDAAMRAWRRKQLGFPANPTDAGDFDLVVIGGGTSGSCSAAVAAQKGLKVALIQDRPVLGGNTSPEIKVAVQGLKGNVKYPAVHDITKRNLGEMKKSFKGQSNLNVSVWMHAFAVEKDGGRITAVIGQNCLTGEGKRFRAPLFVDCTGDATIGFLAGADFHYGREGKEETKEKRAPDKADLMHLGLSILWRSVTNASPSSFRDCPWAIRITSDNYSAAAGDGSADGGGWNWETGFFDAAPDSDEMTRDRLFRAIYGTWDYRKNRA